MKHRFRINYQIILCFIAILLFLFVFRKLIMHGQLTYGDIPYFDVNLSRVNFLYSWTESNLGTNVRQGFNTFRDAIIYFASPASFIFFFIKYYLPIILIPFSYYFCLKKLGIKNKHTLLVASVLPL